MKPSGSDYNEYSLVYLVGSMSNYSHVNVLFLSLLILFILVGPMPTPGEKVDPPGNGETD